MTTQHGMGLMSKDIYPLGYKNVRLWDVGVTWKDINPEPDVWDWSRLDDIVRLGQGLGTKNFTYVLGMTPQWAAKYKNADHFAPWIGPGSNSMPAKMSYWEAYVWNVATRYQGQIQNYQIWNEPQLRDFWHDYSKIDVLARMTKRAHSIIRRIDPDAKIVAAPILPRPSSGGVRRGAKYLVELKKLKWPVDVFSCHIYPEKRMGALRWKKMAQTVINTLEQLDAPDKPLWVTETNYNLLNGEIKSLLRTRNYIRRTNKYANKLGIDRVYWYAYGIHSDPNVLGIPFYSGSKGDGALKSYLW